MPTQTKNIAFTTQDQCEIRGTMYVPEASNGGAIICLHQLRLDRSTYDHFAHEMATRGFYVLAIDLRGHGESTNIQGKTLTHESMTEDDFRKIPGLDVESAKSFLMHEYKINPESIGLVGASIGANAALISAGRNPQTSFVVALSPGIDYRGIQPGNDVSQIQKPVLLLTSQEDTYSAASCNELFPRIPAQEKQIQVVETNEHGTNLFHDPELEKFVCDWISHVTR